MTMKNPRWWFWRAVVVPSRSFAITEDTDSSSDTQISKFSCTNVQIHGACSYNPNTAMPSYQLLMICTRPLGRIDNVALKRWTLFTVE